MVTKKNERRNLIKEERKKYIKFCPKCNSIDIYQDKSTMQSLGYLPTKYICNNCGYSSFNFPEIDINELDKLHLQNKQGVKESKNQSELIDTSYGKFYVKVMWKIVGPIFLVFGLIYIYITISSHSYEGLDLLIGMIIAILGTIMCYITFTQKQMIRMK
ncbi:hypothetical protein HYW20_08900 [Candidatus Woesearchaeota archaeon]|nr:hypothetical protein [Candidatus Woesearchaeota archaeon]